MKSNKKPLEQTFASEVNIRCEKHNFSKGYHKSGYGNDSKYEHRGESSHNYRGKDYDQGRGSSFQGRNSNYRGKSRGRSMGILVKTKDIHLVFPL